MTELQKKAADMVIDAIHDYENSSSPQELHERLMEFFNENQIGDRRDFLAGVKLVAVWESNPDVDQAGPTVGIMDDGWQEWAKDAVKESWNNGDYGDEVNAQIERLEKEIDAADITQGASFNGPMGFSISIAPTNALDLLSEMGDFAMPEDGPRP